jgi:hypothetical protein
MAKLSDLRPGDHVTSGLMSATFISQVQHPIQPAFQLVTWVLADTSISLDCLWPSQDVGEVVPGDNMLNLRLALLGG